MEYVSPIIERNRDVRPIVHAACQYGFHVRGVRNAKKQFAMLVTADVHECSAQLKSAVDYANEEEAIDACICLGDLQARNFAETDGTWYANEVLRSQKPFLSLLGNHDVGNSADGKIAGTSRMAFGKFLRATQPATGLLTYEEPYFVTLFETYKVALIGLDNFDSPTERDENGNYRSNRSNCALSQRQIDFLIGALADLPQGYHLLLAMHAYPYRTETVDCLWTDPSDEHGHPFGMTPYGDDNIISDIVDAWVHGKRLSRSYAPLANADLYPTLQVDCDFSGRGEGIFAAYLVGHEHRDRYLRSEKYPYQNIIGFPATGADDWQNFCSDLPRARGTKAEDAITVLSLHTEKRELRLVRIGSYFTMQMTERKYFVISY